VTLKAYWRFDGGSAHDDTGNGHNGVDTAMSYGSPAKIGQAAQFAGAGGNRSIFPAVVLGGTWSLSGWVRAAAFPGPGTNAMVFGDAATGHGIRCKQNVFNFLFGAGFDIPLAGGLSINTQYHIGVACHGVGGDVDIYFNGVLDRTISGWGVSFSPDRFGSDLINLDYQGAADEWGVWDRLLTAPEFAAVYNGGAGLSPYAVNFPDALPLPVPPPIPDVPTIPASAYARQLKALFPPGRAFNLEPNSVIDQACVAMAQELGRVDARGADLINEADPRTADELIADWERMVGLPDAQVPVISGVLAERQAAVTAKYVARGGQSYNFFKQLVAACGYSLHSIDRFGDKRFTCVSLCTDPLYAAEYAYAMNLNVNAPVGAALTHAELEAVIRKATHSHITPFVTYL
jgi:uncharacterized protein YmfQ (DUF2313 family)